MKQTIIKINNSEINIHYLVENVWHIRAVYDKLVKENKIEPFSNDCEDRYENGCYRSCYYELDKLTEIAIEFASTWETTEFAEYRTDYDEAICNFAEQKLIDIYGSKTNKINSIIRQLTEIKSWTEDIRPYEQNLTLLNDVLRQNLIMLENVLKTAKNLKEDLK